MAFINNLFEMRGDAFKIAVHNRRAIPTRTDTIEPWLETLTFLTWLGALTNSALVYLFSPQLLPDHQIRITNSTLSNDTMYEALGAQVPNANLSGGNVITSSLSPSSMLSAMNGLLLKAILVSLVASHGFLLVRELIRHIVEKIFWRGSGEVEERVKEERNVKAKFLSGLTGVEMGGSGSSNVRVNSAETGEKETDEDEDEMGFWEHDEGLEEIQRISKEA